MNWVNFNLGNFILLHRSFNFIVGHRCTIVCSRESCYVVGPPFLAFGNGAQMVETAEGWGIFQETACWHRVIFSETPGVYTGQECLSCDVFVAVPKPSHAVRCTRMVNTRSKVVVEGLASSACVRLVMVARHFVHQPLIFLGVHA